MAGLRGGRDLGVGRMAAQADEEHQAQGPHKDGSHRPQRQRWAWARHGLWHGHLEKQELTQRIWQLCDESPVWRWGQAVKAARLGRYLPLGDLPSSKNNH